MNKRTRVTLSAPLLACSLAIGPAAAAVWAATPQALPTAAQCFVEPKPGDATKSIITGEGFTKATKVTVDQTDGPGGVLITVGEDGKFTVPDQPNGKYAATAGGTTVTCLSGQAAQDTVNKNAIDAARKAGATEGFTTGKDLAQAGNCDAKPQPKPLAQGLVADTAAMKAAKEAHDLAFDTAFNAAIKRYCTD
ncbi:hypothetical protein ACFXA3_27345 [Streptomyces sp. NPDC059456]|uniref:hypothetical protein n=1 Tax=Streptomyces sp. NPDC059456 TaxID=3346838 RepID=UPI0036775310